MSYALKTSGLATALLACVAVDQDGTTVKDFVAGNTAVHNANVGTPKTGTGTWKSVVRGWFKTDHGVDGFAPHGVTWASGPNLPMGNGSSGIGFFAALNLLATAGQFAWATGTDINNCLAFDGANKQKIRLGATDKAVSGTALPTGTTKFSFGVNQKYNTGTAIEQTYFYGLESGSLASDGVYAEGGYASDALLAMYGGAAGNGSFEGNHHIACWFNRPLTLVEMQSLHNDWFGTLFDATGVTITNADDEVLQPGEVGINIVCTGAGATQGVGAVYLSPTDNIADGSRVAQTVTSWADTQITINIVRGSLPFNTNLYLFILNDSGVSNSAGYVVQLAPNPAVLAYGLMV